MKITQAEWNDYINKLSSLSQKASDEFKAWANRNGGWREIDRQLLLEAGYSFATKYAEGSAALASAMYDAIANAENKRVPSAELSADIEFKEMAKAINGALKHSDNDEFISSTVGRAVKQAGADTMLKNASRDGAEFAWIPSGDTCPFCLVLASRGWQKASKKTTNGNHAEHIHTHCNCQFAIRFNKNTNVEGYDPEAYQKIYYDADGKNSAEKLKSMFSDYRSNSNQNGEKERRIILSGDTYSDKTPKRNLTIRKDENRKQEVYISNNASIKPKELSNIINDIDYSIKAFGGNSENYPRIVVVSKGENNDALASYNCLNNTLYVIPEIGNRSKIVKMQKGLAEPENPKSTAVHEVWHWVQAERYRKDHGTITNENLSNYNQWIVKKAKEHLDKAGINRENVRNISDKAAIDFDFKKFDEVEAEYQVVKTLRE